MAEEAAPAARPKAGPVRARPAPRDEDEDDRPRRRPTRDDYDDEGDDRPRRRPSRVRSDEGEEDEDDYDDAPRPGVCPKCGSRKSTKVSFTWWGGLVGPSMFNMVHCRRCRTNYNSKTGTPVGAVHIALYSLVSLVIVVIIIVLINLAGK